MSVPWESRAIELEAKDGPYCDYVAFLEWFDKELSAGPWDCLRDIIEMNEPNGMIPIYTLICNAYAHSADTPIVVTETAP